MGTQTHIVMGGQVCHYAFNEKNYAALQERQHTQLKGLSRSQEAFASAHDALPVLMDLAADQRTDPGTRKAACIALGEMGDHQAIPVLIQAVQAEQGEMIQAVWALGAIGEVSVPVLLDLLASRQMGELTQEMIKMTLISMGQSAIPGLIDRLWREGEDWRLLSKILLILGAIREPATIPALRHVLHFGDPALSYAAATALILMGHPQAQEALLHALGDENPIVRGVTAANLGLYHQIYARQALEALQDDPANLSPWQDRSVGDVCREAVQKLG